MNDRAVAVFDQYDFEISNVRKGRGMLIVTTPIGEVALKEYNGSEEKLEWQEAFTKGLKSKGFSYVDELYRDKNGNLIVSDYEGTRYIVKDFIAGRECNVSDSKECVLAVKQMAHLHMVVRELMKEPFFIRHKVEPEVIEDEVDGISDTAEAAHTPKGDWDSKEEAGKERQSEAVNEPVYEWIPVEESSSLQDIINRNRDGFLRYESEKKRSEIARARQFIRKKACKNDFDLLFLKEYNRFMKQIEYADNYLTQEEYQKLEDFVRDKKLYCHGDCNHHNILFSDGIVYIQNLERCRPDLQIKDLYLFVRKVCEKNNWSFDFGRACIDAYMEEMPVSHEEIKYLYTRFCYPEKFWKIANGYMNHKKSLLPNRQKEKLEALLEMEEIRNAFLEKFRTYYIEEK